MSSSDLTRARIATYALFLIHGIYISTWIAAIPGLKIAFKLDDGQLGFALLCSGIASFFVTLPAGRVIEAVGPSVVALFAGMATPLLASTLPFLTGSPRALYALAFLNGGIYVGVGISMNSQAVKLERLCMKPIMSSFHACWSIGALSGSAHYAFLLRCGCDWSSAFPLTCYVVAIGTAAAALAMEALPSAGEVCCETAERTRAPVAAEGALYVPMLCAMGCFAMLTEGSVGDWTGIYFIRYDGATLVSAPLGYSACAGCMTCCRLWGDRLVAAFGRRNVFACGSLLGVIGFSLLMSVNRLEAGLLGCALLGLGLANNIPILTTSIGQTNKIAPSVSIAALATASQTGLLAGPAILGFVSRLYGLRVAFVGPLICLLAISAASVILPDDDDEKNELSSALLIDIAYAAPLVESP